MTLFIMKHHTLTIRLERPIYRAFSGEGRCEDKIAQIAITREKTPIILCHFKIPAIYITQYTTIPLF